MVALQAAPIERSPRSTSESAWLSSRDAQKAERLKRAVLTTPYATSILHPQPAGNVAHLTLIPSKQIRPFILQRPAMELPHRLVQIADQPRDRLRPASLARQPSHHTAHLAVEIPRKSLRGPRSPTSGTALKLLHPTGRNLLPRSVQWAAEWCQSGS